jgi:hypothetical protein
MMTGDRKKPGVAFWGTVVVVALLAYPLSFGPACWLAQRDAATTERLAPRLYWPIGWAFTKSPRGVIRGVIHWYATLGNSEIVSVHTTASGTNIVRFGK